MLNTVAILFVSNVFYNENYHRIFKFLLDQLQSHNFSVEKISFVKKQENIIRSEINFLSKEHDFVIVIVKEVQTKIILKALGDVCNEDLVKQSQLSNNFSSNGVNEEYDKKLCTKHLKFIDNKKSYGLIFHVHQIYILKEENIEDLLPQFLKNYLVYYQEEPIYRKKFQIEMADIPKNKVDGFTFVKSNSEHVTILLEKTNFDSIIQEELDLRKQFNGKVIEVCDIDIVSGSIYKGKEEHIYDAIQTIEKCLATYGFDNVFLTFNGGKDCTVLLHLLNIVKKIRYRDYQKPIFCLYVRDNDTFPEQDKFVAQCQVFYNLDILTLPLGMKEALSEFLKRKPNMKASFLGTRRTDPYSETLNTFQMTDNSWPAVMRVSPLLDWHYSEIWNYLLYYKVPYCKLYDQGYTSLGSASGTVKNPALLHYSVALDKKEFLPAYKLLNEAEERNGRDNKKK